MILGLMPCIIEKCKESIQKQGSCLLLKETMGQDKVLHKKGVVLCFAPNWNKTAKDNKVELKISTLKTITNKISNNKTFTSTSLAF
jgi:hypothetical protein